MQIEKLFETISRIRETVEKNSNRLSVLLTVGMCCFFILGAYDGMVRAEDDVYIDVAGSYEEASTKVFVATNDRDNNIQVLDETSKTASLVNLAGTFYGYEAYGEAARERAIAEGVSDIEMHGLLGTVDQGVHAMAINPPGLDVYAHLGNQWIPGYGESTTTTVLAQEDGYDFLTNPRYVGLEPVWSVFRNLAYAGFVIIIMVSGFMIMFRSKLDGQVTVNVVNAIPGIVVGLIMVTFSMAIIGFTVDLARLFTAIIANFMKGLPGTYQPIYLGGPLQLIWDAFGAFGGLGTAAVGGGMLGLGFLVSTAASATFLGPFGAIIGVIGLLIILIIAGIAMFAATKVYITLITSYVKIFIEVLLGPIYILLGSLPGKSSMITGWFKRALSAALVFPVVFFIINLGAYIGQSELNTGLGSSMQFLAGGEASTPIIPIRGAFVIALYFFAAGAPGIVEEMLAVTSSKGGAEAGKGTKAALSKIPFIGGAMSG